MNDLFVVDQSIKRCNDDDSSAELRFRQNVVVGLGGGVPLVVGHVCFVENSPLVELQNNKMQKYINTRRGRNIRKQNSFFLVKWIVDRQI